MLRCNKAFRLATTTHVTSFNQPECIISYLKNCFMTLCPSHLIFQKHLLKWCQCFSFSLTTGPTCNVTAKSAAPWLPSCPTRSFTRSRTKPRAEISFLPASTSFSMRSRSCLQVRCLSEQGEKEDEHFGLYLNIATFTKSWHPGGVKLLLSVQCPPLHESFALFVLRIKFFKHPEKCGECTYEFLKAKFWTDHC